MPSKFMSKFIRILDKNFLVSRSTAALQVPCSTKVIYSTAKNFQSCTSARRDLAHRNLILVAHRHASLTTARQLQTRCRPPVTLLQIDWRASQRGARRPGHCQYQQKRNLHPVAVWSLVGKYLVRYSAWMLGRSLRKKAAGEESTQKFSRGKKLAFSSLFFVVTGGMIVVLNIEEVPYTRRNRLQLLHPDSFHDITDISSEGFIEEYEKKGMILRKTDSRHIRVASLVARLTKTLKEMPALAASEAALSLEWKVHVIDEDNFNAFVLVRDKIFSFHAAQTNVLYAACVRISIHNTMSCLLTVSQTAKCPCISWYAVLLQVFHFL
jgi:hypothetical protein